MLGRVQQRVEIADIAELVVQWFRSMASFGYLTWIGCGFASSTLGSTKDVADGKFIT
jgi:hypothetical protein